MKKELPATCKMNGKTINLIKEIPVNHTYVLGIYTGTLSPNDILIRYRQFENNDWTSIRTPKHIHWAVDVLMKLNEKPRKTKQFIDLLIDIWAKTEPITNEATREKLLSDEYLLKDIEAEVVQYKALAKKGEYSIKFLILLAKLLMLQEKSNRQDAYMFSDLLTALKQHQDIFKIVSLATHHRRK